MCVWGGRLRDMLGEARARVRDREGVVGFRGVEGWRGGLGDVMLDLLKNGRSRIRFSVGC